MSDILNKIDEVLKEDTELPLNSLRASLIMYKALERIVKEWDSGFNPASSRDHMLDIAEEALAKVKATMTHLPSVDEPIGKMSKTARSPAK